MSIKQLLIEANAIQVGVQEDDWQRVIALAAQPLVNQGYIHESYYKAVIDNTLTHGAYYVFDEGIAIPHARPECGVIKNCFSLVLLEQPIAFGDGEKADIVILFGATDGQGHIQDGIRAIVELLDNPRVMQQLRAAKQWQEVVDIL
ncbi:PTS sugar transporter subunit IIA [Serratia odorifera]|jgi:ascorbate PTS system EIIA or EIIAB component|uniref:Ascorbate-specific PTS system EIIA component n=2 Tax=Serratia odorifera TaxID=618 RepID=D4E6Q0_SEROD|nr:PTS sugar transporter subunit IIA [Serratia odorifera]EFE94616.1 phosphoenolpyruvate-dependent sugar phosphotransferase system, EIIA 2 [Serratia odorifera DSM 4582]MBJ2065004.1 PTS sugar transporter subunit IIA [Serratia odorifera]PNK89338.1 PTS fructose transporter subunit IIA [Serratia odorifera]RII70417.1 PTS fructose transporter subunit IIA [Serratia odorifera]VDZ63597.1 Ascorbate-specific phosphotransferase enzyme IIA component [Serratia odorifera]